MRLKKSAWVKIKVKLTINLRVCLVTAYFMRLAIYPIYPQKVLFLEARLSLNSKLNSLSINLSKCTASTIASIV